MHNASIRKLAENFVLVLGVHFCQKVLRKPLNNSSPKTNREYLPCLWVPQYVGGICMLVKQIEGKFFNGILSSQPLLKLLTEQTKWQQGASCTKARHYLFNCFPNPKRMYRGKYERGCPEGNGGKIYVMIGIIIESSAWRTIWPPKKHCILLGAVIWNRHSGPMRVGDSSEAISCH